MAMSEEQRRRLAEGARRVHEAGATTSAWWKGLFDTKRKRILAGLGVAVAVIVFLLALAQ